MNAFRCCQSSCVARPAIRGGHAMAPLTVRQPRTQTAVSAVMQSIFDVALNVKRLSGRDAAALNRLYAFTAGTARCRVGPELSQKYNMEQDNAQLVVSVTNQAMLETTWFNEVRTRKPQTFKADAGAPVDPTDGGRKCDFCNWQSLTAEDAWGRIERQHAVTGSNLFKYGEPAHGLVLFKHHDPLAFSRHQLADFLAVSEDWFAAASAAHPEARHPFFIWNCGPRAGASQFHGHGQLMLTTAPVPAQARLTRHAAQHSQAHLGTGYFQDLVRAHAAVGLARVVGQEADRCWLVAHLAPHKDMEVILLGAALTSPAFVAALHAVLRALVDRLGVQTFNCGVLDVPLRAPGHLGEREEGAAAAGYGGSAEAADASPRTEMGQEPERCGSSMHARGRGAIGREGIDVEESEEEAECQLGLPAAGVEWRPMMARVVSRGKITSPASDYGCLEVVGHASIGHTDPFVLIRAIDEQLAAGAGA